MPPKSYIKFKDAYYDDVVNPLQESSESSLDSFIAEDEEEGNEENSASEESSHETEDDTSEGQETAPSNDDEPSSNRDEVTRSGRKVHNMKSDQKSALAKLKASREKTKTSQSCTSKNEKSKAKKSIDFSSVKKPQDKDESSGDDSQNSIISPPKNTGKRKLSALESDEGDSDDVIILSPSTKKRSKRSRIELSSDSDF